MGAIGLLAVGRHLLRIVFVVAVFSLPAFGETLLYLGDLVPDGDGYAVLDVVLETDDNVGALQGDILFDNTIVDLVKSDCEINPVLGLFPRGQPPAVSCFEDTSLGPCKNLTSVVRKCGESPQPLSCPEGADNTISAFRGFITGTAALNLNAIPSSVVFSCRFRIVDPARLAARIGLNNVVLSDLYGTRRLDGSSRDRGCDSCPAGGCYGNLDCSALHCEPANGGAYPGHCVSAPPSTPPPISTPPLFPSPTPTSLTMGETSLHFDEPVPDGDDYVIVNVILDTDTIVGGFQGDLLFDNTVVGLTPGDCRINPAVGLFPLGPPPAISCFDDSNIGPCKNLTKGLEQCDETPEAYLCFSRPGTIGVLRVIVVATAAPNLHAIPSGSVFSCRFRILDPARLSTRIFLDKIVVSDPYGSLVDAPSSANVCLGDCSSGGCYGHLDCESMHCEPASGGGYPGRCWSPPTPTPPIGCNNDSDCSPGNCDLTKPSDHDIGTCVMPTPTPSSSGSGCVPSSCASGYCVDNVCCQDASCEGLDRCDIAGFEGRCTSPRSEGEECRSHRDCAYPFGCIARRCAALNLTPVPARPDAPQIPAGRPAPPASASDPVAHAADDGCGISRRGATGRATWLLAIAALIVVARSRARTRHL